MLPSPVEMHIPDGFLSVVVALALWLVSLTVLAYALKHANTELNERQVPLMGILAATIFAGQMLNFSVTGGTSGHLVGAAIATALLGPWPAILVMTSVVSIQALVFQDGGLLALGANIFNMAIVGVFVAHFTYHTVRRILKQQPWGIAAAGFIAGWLSIFIAALACALELALSGTSPANIAIPAMGGIHALIGIGEGLITAGALLFVRAARPGLITDSQLSGAALTGNSRAVWIGGLLLAVLLATLAPWASSHPDGLEWVAEQHGFLQSAQDPLYALIPDYMVPGISNEALATILAGIIGSVIVFGTALGVGYTRHHRNGSSQRSAA